MASWNGVPWDEISHHLEPHRQTGQLRLFHLSYDTFYSWDYFLVSVGRCVLYSECPVSNYLVCLKYFPTIVSHSILEGNFHPFLYWYAQNFLMACLATLPEMKDANLDPINGCSDKDLVKCPEIFFPAIPCVLSPISIVPFMFCEFYYGLMTVEAISELIW